MKEKISEEGQIVVIALLVMVVVLAIGLSVIGRSAVEISTSTKTEESSRAFTAAEAGIERAILRTIEGETGGLNSIDDFTNQSTASVQWSGVIPPAGTALEHPPVGKESFAQFWLANPKENVPGTNRPAGYYNQSNFYVYFGIPKIYSSETEEEPGLEVKVVSWDNTEKIYKLKRYVYDSSSPQRPNFNACDFTMRKSEGIFIKTNNYATASRSFYCRVTISDYMSGSGDYPVLIRARILFSNSSQPIAVEPYDKGGSNSSLPSQAQVYRSTGSAGNTQRVIQVFRQDAVVPHFFDYVLFSAGDLEK